MKSGLQKYSAFNVYGFTQSALALEHFEIKVKNYDLLISDIRMPQMNGFEFIKKVRAIKPEVKVFFYDSISFNRLHSFRFKRLRRVENYLNGFNNFYFFSIYGLI
jgi:two-component SAPR family response regulator